MSNQLPESVSIPARVSRRGCQCEPYCGSAAVLLRKSPSDFEILNDLDSNVTTFYRVLRDRSDDLIQAIALTPYAREEQLLAYQETDDELEKARRFFVRSWQGFGGGCKRRTGWRYMYRHTRSQTTIDDWNHVEDLWHVAARLRQVQIESNQALKIIQRYDTPDTCFFVDPPYVQSTRGTRSKETYFHEMDDTDHRTLAGILHSIQGKVIISGYPSTLYDELYRDWRMVTCQSQTLTNQTATECLWVSPRAWEVSAQLHLFEQVF